MYAAKEVCVNKVIIGNEEWCHFKSLHIPAIKARVDSGAKTSALHAFNIKPFKKNGQLRVVFSVHPFQNDRVTVVDCEAVVVDKRWVKSSSGQTEKRFVIETSVQIGHYELTIEVTLTNRDSMGYRMLLGRNAMQQFLIDPSASCNLGAPINDLPNNNDDKSAVLLPFSILLLVVDEQDKSAYALCNAIKSANHLVTVRTFSSLNLGQELPTPKYDLVHARAHSQYANFACNMLDALRVQDIPSVNTASALRNAFDLARLYQYLSIYDIPLPLHKVGQGEEMLIKNSHELNKPHSYNVVSTLRFGFQPQFTPINNLSVPVIPNEFPYLMLNISNKEAVVIRSLMVYEECLGHLQLPLTELIDNRNAFIPLELNEDQKDLLYKITSIVGLKLFSVDLLLSDGVTQFLSLNASPDIIEFSQCIGWDISAKTIELIEKKLTNKV